MQMEISTDLLTWLNKTTERSHEVILVNSFVFMLTKIKKQQYVRITIDGWLHRRFWSALDKAYDYKLFHPKKDKQNNVALYHFYFQVAVKEQLISTENDKGQITERGIKFLTLSKNEQLALLLNHIWE